jgi:hypothetical protein
MQLRAMDHGRPSYVKGGADMSEVGSNHSDRSHFPLLLSSLSMAKPDSFAVLTLTYCHSVTNAIAPVWLQRDN